MVFIILKSFQNFNKPGIPDHWIMELGAKLDNYKGLHMKQRKGQAIKVGIMRNLVDWR